LTLTVLSLLLACGDKEPSDSAISNFVDEDGDGYPEQEDCDDTNADISPVADELCDGIDNDCDGEIDTPDALDALQGWADADGDGFGDPSSPLQSCEAAPLVDNDLDCDDASAEIHPDADELCDELDNDCDGETDEDSAIDAGTWYADEDADGYGDADVSTLACTQPSNTVADDSDCDDSSDQAFPGGTEVCDGLDNDCDGAVDGNTVPGDYATVQEAIDDLSDGAEICVSAGTHSEGFDLSGRSLDLVGAGGSEATIFDLSGADLSAGPWATSAGEGGASSLTGFTITGITDAPGRHWEDSPGHTFYVSGDSLGFTDIQFVDNSFLIEDDSPDLEGGFVHIDSTGTVTVRELVATGNTWTVYNNGGTSQPNIDGGLFYVYEGGVLDLEGLEFSDNTITTLDTPYGLRADGMVLYSYQGEVRVVDATLTDNLVDATFYDYAYSDGMLFGHYGAEVEYEDVHIEGNQLYFESTEDFCYSYGLIRFFGSTGTVTNLSLVDNDIALDCSRFAYAYGGLYVYDDEGDMVIDGLTATGNSLTAWDAELDYSYAQGGGSYISGTASLSHVDIRDNAAFAYGVYGAGLRMGAYNGTASLSNAVIAGNLGGDALTGYAYGAGLDIYLYKADIEVSNVTVVGNDLFADEAYGGGVSVNAYNSSDSLLFWQNTVTGNSASGTEEALGEDVWTGGFDEASISWSFNNYGSQDSEEGGEFAGDATDLSEDPGFVDASDSDPLNWNLSLDSGSALIDAGDPDCTDSDGSTCDIGAYGGPGGDW
jgi:hypothetical protein